MIRSILSRKSVSELSRGCCVSKRIEQRCRFSSAKDKTDDKDVSQKIEKSKKSGPVYPAFRSMTGRKPDLTDLLKDLQSDNKENTAVVDAPPLKYFPDKVAAHCRVEVLLKHADFHVLKSAAPALVEEEIQVAEKIDVENPEDSNIPQDTNVQSKKKEINPDNSEVGNLLKALIQEKISGENVQNIMANVKSGDNTGQRISDDVRSAIRGGTMMGHAFKEGLKKHGQWTGKDRPMNDRMGRGRKERSGELFAGPRTHYFDDLFKTEKFDDKDLFISIHELKWQEQLYSEIQKQGPSNGFEELMLHADKMWSFPINNEVGLDENDQSTFEDHVFLDDHLDLFPEQGHVKRFMELVLTGLQQNPYISLQQKIDSIYWFKDYFDKFTDEDLEF